MSTHDVYLLISSVACRIIRVSASSWSEAKPSKSLSVEGHTFIGSPKPPLNITSFVGFPQNVRDSVVQRKFAKLSLFSSRMINLSYLPIFRSLLSTSLFIPLSFPCSHVFHVCWSFFLSRPKTTSTLLHLSERMKQHSSKTGHSTLRM